MWKTDLENIGIDTRSMFISSLQAICAYFTFFTHCDCRILSSHVKKILFHSKYFMGLLIYHLDWQTTQIPTGFVCVAISGGFCENWARLTGLYHRWHTTTANTRTEHTSPINISCHRYNRCILGLICNLDLCSVRILGLQHVSCGRYVGKNESKESGIIIIIGPMPK